MMWGWLIVGIIIGWATKVPFLLKWYNELKATKTYESAMRWLRKIIWRKWEKKVFVTFAEKQHPSISYLLLVELLINGENLFVEMGRKKYTEYFCRKCANLHASLTPKSNQK